MDNTIGEQVDWLNRGLSPKEIAKRTGRDRKTVKRWLHVGVSLPDGTLIRLTPATKLGGDVWRVKPADVDEWMRTHVDPTFTPNEPAPETREQRIERLRAELREIDDRIHTLYARRCDRRDELQELHQDVTELELIWDICDADFE